MKSARPRVSIGLPVHDGEDYVAAAIESLLAQTYRDFELVISDNASTDAGLELVRQRYPRVRVIPLDRNDGPGAARNAGMAAARGDYIAFLDSDDEWLPDKLNAQVDYFNTHPDALICQTEEIWVRNGVRVNPGKRHRKQAGMIFERSLALCLVSPSAVMIRRSLLEEVGLFDESLPACEDYDLWLRIAWKYPVHLIDRPLIVKRGGHEDQLSRMPELDKFRIQSICGILDQDCLLTDQRNAAIGMLSAKCAIYAKGCRRRGRVAEAEKYELLPEKYEQR